MEAKHVNGDCPSEPSDERNTPDADSLAAKFSASLDTAVPVVATVAAAANQHDDTLQEDKQELAHHNSGGEQDVNDGADAEQQLRERSGEASPLRWEGQTEDATTEALEGEGKGQGPTPESPTDAAAREQEKEDDFAWGAPKHIFVLSSAGKPVFSLLGDEQRLSTLMGLVQGLLSLCADCGGDEMESISAGSRRFVFLRRGDLVLVAVSSLPSSSCSSLPSLLGSDESNDGEGGSIDGNGNSDGLFGKRLSWPGEGEEAPECESFLRLQLEYMYASILFLLTSKVQSIFRRSPGYDLRGLLGGADTSLRGIIELAEPSRGRGRMLASGVETVWMDPDIRAKVARFLQSAQEAAAPSALYAIWLCGEKVVSLAQPRAPSHRLHSRDLLLLVNFVATQSALRNAESWTPVCFPRFHEQGYLHAYIAFLEDPLVPMRSNGNSLSAQGLAEENGGSGGESDNFVVQNNGSGKSARTGGESCIILVSVEASSEQFQAFRRSRAALELRFRSALGIHWDRYLGEGAAMERKAILTKFCRQMRALHFTYCLRGRQGGAPCVTQCLSSPFVDPLADDPATQRRIWGHYTRAALRLRRGSCQEGRVFCRSEEEDGNLDVLGGGGSVSSGEFRSSEAGGRGKGREVDEATALFESDPVHSLAYQVGARETVMSLFGRRDERSGGGRWTSAAAVGGTWGDRDELHACFPSSVAPEVAYKEAVRLVAIIRRDIEWLFLTGTCAPK